MRPRAEAISGCGRHGDGERQGARTHELACHRNCILLGQSADQTRFDSAQRSLAPPFQRYRVRIRLGEAELAALPPSLPARAGWLAVRHRQQAAASRSAAAAISATTLKHFKAQTSGVQPLSSVQCLQCFGVPLPGAALWQCSIALCAARRGCACRHLPPQTPPLAPAQSPAP